MTAPSEREPPRPAAPPQGPPQHPLPGFSLGSPTRGRILPSLPRSAPWQSQLPVLELPGLGIKASAHRTLNGDPRETTGVAAIDVGFAFSQRNHRFREVAVAHAGPDFLPQEIHLFWVLHGYDLPEDIQLPPPWQGVPAHLHIGTETQLLPPFLQALGGRLIVAHNLGGDQQVLAGWFRRVNLDEPMPRPFHGYDTLRAEQGLSTGPYDLASTHKRRIGQGWWKSTVTDALMALDIARHQAGSLTALQQATVKQMATYTYPAVKAPVSPVIWIEDEPFLPYGTKEEPVTWSSDITYVRSLAAAAPDYIARLLHTDLDFAEKQRIFDRWRNSRAAGAGSTK